MNEPARGKVFITGAGPGAVDLLTLRAAHLLERADIVFHDSLISPQVLALCPASCVMVSVGKRCGLPDEDRQTRIHQLLDDATLQYSVVVRLKGGDPGVFGRSGEELEYLVSHKIPWEVIPGISSGLGGLSALGLPLTHRALASSVTLLTGSEGISGAFPGIPVPLSPSQTLVFYMGFQHTAAMVADLLRLGMDPSTYALCASRLSCPEQRLLAAPLHRIGSEVNAAGMETPALLVVGNVVKLWKTFQVDQA
jgi:uroporphyrin-III C-methyltransferase